MPHATLRVIIYVEGLASDAVERVASGLTLADGTKFQPGTLEIVTRDTGGCTCATQLEAFEEIQQQRDLLAHGETGSGSWGGASTAKTAKTLPPQQLPPKCNSTGSVGAGCVVQQLQCAQSTLNASNDTASRAEEVAAVNLAAYSIAPPSPSTLLSTSPSPLVPTSRPHAATNNDNACSSYDNDNACSSYSHVRVTINEGKFHQVKKMVAAVGGFVHQYVTHNSKIECLPFTKTSQG